MNQNLKNHRLPLMNAFWQLLCITILSTSVAHAAEWSLDSTLNPSTKYDDNVFMAENAQGSVQYSISPSLIVKRAMENSEISLTAGYKVNRYISLSVLDRQDPFVQFSSSLKTERSQYGLAASYSQSSSRSTAEADSGDFATESSVTSETISPSYSYKLTERDSLSIGGSYSTRTYSTTDFSDNETISINSGWQHQFTERLSGGLSVSVSNYQSNGLALSTDDDNYNVSTTINYKLSELWQISGQVGLRQLNSSSTSLLGGSQSTSSSGSSFDFTATKQAERDSFSMGLSRSLSPSSTGDVNEQDRLTISWSRKLTEHLSTSMSASYQQSTSALSQGSEQRDNLNLSPSLNWQFERNLGLNLAYNYRQQKKSIANTNVNSNAIIMTLTYDWDGLRVSR